MAETCLLAAREHALLRTLKRVMEPSFEVVGMIDNAASLADSIGSLEPSLVVVDLRLLEPTPDRILEIVRRRAPDTPVIGLRSDLDEAEGKATPPPPGLAAIVPHRCAAQGLVAAARAALAL